MLCLTLTHNEEITVKGLDHAASVKDILRRFNFSKLGLMLVLNALFSPEICLVPFGGVKFGSQVRKILHRTHFLKKYQFNR